MDYLNFSTTRYKFDDPFLMPSSDYMPDNLETALDFCRFLYMLNPQYRQAGARVMRHFITDFDYPSDDASKKEKDEWDDFLHHQLQLPLFMAEVGDEYTAYGNAFIRIHFPFDRFLIDEKSGKSYSLDFFGRDAKYNYQTMKYDVPKPGGKAGERIKLPFRDQKSTDITRIRIRKLDPRFVILRHVNFSGTTHFVYRFEPTMIDDVKKGRLHVVNELPMLMLRAIAKNQDFIFNPDTILHFKAPTISGISNSGWGLPGTIANFRNIYQLQVYRKIDEAVGLDYMLPFRLFSPDSKQSLNEQIYGILADRWASEIGTIIDNRRKDKFAMHCMPFPVQYQEFGAEGKELTPKDLLEYQTATMLDGMGYPQELFTSSLQYLQIPTAVRLFEQSWLFVHIGFNQMAQWATKHIRSYLGLAPLKVTLQRPTVADNVERKQMMFQLASMGEISRETGYHGIGIDDVPGEMRKRMEEDAERQRQQFKMQQELQKEMETGTIMAPQQSPGQGEGSLPGGAGGGEQAGGNTTPMDVQNKAQELAQYWLQIPDQGQRSQAMQATSHTDPQLYALAKETMERIRRQGASQGRQQVYAEAQQQSAGGAGAGSPSGPGSPSGAGGAGGPGGGGAQ